METEQIDRPTKVTITQFAEMLGVTHAAVSRAISTGRMTKSVEEAPNGKKLIDVKLGVLEFNNKQRGAVNFSDKPGRQKRDESEAGDSEARLKRYKAELARIELEEAEGKLVNADKVKRQAFKIARTVRDTMLNIPDRLAAILAAETDNFQVHKILTDEIVQALEALNQSIVDFKDDEEILDDENSESIS